MNRPSRDDHSDFDDQHRFDDQHGFEGHDADHHLFDEGEAAFGNNGQHPDPPADSERDFENDLLGYVLGALDEEETRQIDELIRDFPDLEDELQLIRMSIAPLERLNADTPPPVGLARRACEQVASFRSSQDRQLSSDDSDHSGAQLSSSKNEFRAARSSFSVRDMVAIAASVILMAAIAIPAINHNRFLARISNCQNNLRTVGFSLMDYADFNGGRYIGIPSQGNLGVAGCYAPVLLDQGLVEDEGIFQCADRHVVDSDWKIPSTQELLTAKGAKLIELQRRAGGSFAYTMGHFDDDGRYVAPRHLNRSNYVVLADSPSNQPGRNSSNHGGKGQNCFFDDGHIKLVAENSVAGDAIYENDLGQIGPGAHELDSVVAPSHTRLLFGRWPIH